MPAAVLSDPLGISCVFSDGRRSETVLADVANPELARDLLLGLAGMVHPHGSVDAAGTIRHYERALRRLVRTLAEQGFTGGAGELRRAQLVEYWMAASAAGEAGTRRMLQGFAAAGGALDARVAELVAGRAYNLQPFRRPLPPYDESAWTRLRQAAEHAVSTAYRSHKTALAGAERGRDPRDAGCGLDNLRWLLAGSGPMNVFDAAAHLDVSVNTMRRRTGLLQASTELFPHLDVTAAYVLLFSVYSGIVPDGVDDLVLTDLDWAGDASILLSYVKGRTAAESLTLPRPAVRLLEQWLEHSRLLRGFVCAPERNQLWLGIRQRGHVSVITGAVQRGVTRRWLAQHGVLDEDGQPLKLHRHRIRTTHESMRDKRSWRGSGRAMIDPNHSPQVEGDHYLSATTPAQRQAVEAIIVDAQHDMARRAQPPVVITEADTAAVVRDYPQLVTSLHLDDVVLTELVGGQRDVFSAACADQLSGLHGPKGKPCPARPWVCLLCPLAVFAPRHASNLLRLKAFFSRQWQQLPAAQFMAVFGPYSQRVGEVLQRYDPDVLTEASRHVGDHDGELPLRPEELST